jgi:hypothetical protein
MGEWAAELKTHEAFGESFPMDRMSDEAMYVLGVLYQMRKKVSATPDLFEPDASKLIEAEIALYEGLVQGPEAA